MKTPHVRRLLAWSRNPPPDCLRGLPERVVQQVGVACGRGRVCMPEKCADHGQAEPHACAFAGEAMAQVVDAQIVDLGGFDDRGPRVLVIPLWPVALGIREKPFGFGLVVQVGQKL